MKETFNMNTDDFNLADATKSELKKFAANEYGLTLALTMNETTMRQKIFDYCTKNNLEPPKSSIGNSKPTPKGKDPVKMITINIATEKTPGGKEPVLIGLNGVGYTIPRGIDVEVSPAIVEILNNAVQDIVTQDPEGELEHNDVPTYPFSVKFKAA